MCARAGFTTKWLESVATAVCLARLPPTTSGVPPGACPANPTEPTLQERRLPLPTLLLAISRRSSRRLLLRGAVANRNCGAPGEPGAAAAASLASAGGHRQDCGQQAADALLQGCRNRGMCVVLRHCTACSQQSVQRSEHNPPGPRSSTQDLCSNSQPGRFGYSQPVYPNKPTWPGLVLKLQLAQLLQQAAQRRQLPRQLATVVIHHCKKGRFIRLGETRGWPMVA